MKNTTRIITQYAVYAALIFTARMMDHIVSGWLPINFAVITQVVAFTCALIIPTWKNCLAVGIIFGVTSLITSLMFGGGAVVYGMVNPLISVLPRAIVGLGLFGAYALTAFILAKFTQKEIVTTFTASCVASLVGAIVNTVVVLTMIHIFKTVQGMESVLAIFGINALLEWVLTPVLTPFVVIGVRRGLGKRLDSLYNPTGSHKSDSEEQGGEDK